MIVQTTDTSTARTRWRSLRIAAISIALTAIILWMSGCMERLFYYPQPGATPPPRHLSGAESVWFNSKDGTRLHGWFIPARPAEEPVSQTASDPKSPTILHVHGNAGNILSHIWFTEYLPAAGFNLFIFDFRGYGQSEGRARSRRPLIEDTDAALEYLLARREVDPDRIGVYGQSLGGAIALNVMADRAQISAAVIESSFASWRDMAACAIGGGHAPGVLCRALAALLIPDTCRPDRAIARISRPILLIHGDADSIIPVEHSRQLAAASNGSATLVELPGGDHNSLRDSHPHVEQLVIEFFNNHLRPAQPRNDEPVTDTRPRR